MRVVKTPYSLLKRTVNRLLETYRPLAVSNKTVVINDIDDNVQVVTDTVIFEEVLTRILATMCRFTKYSNISIRTRSYHDILLIHFKDNSILSEPAAVSELKKLQPLTERLGGSITVNIAPSRMATVTFSLLNKIESI